MKRESLKKKEETPNPSPQEYYNSSKKTKKPLEDIVYTKIVDDGIITQESIVKTSRNKSCLVNHKATMF